MRAVMPPSTTSAEPLTKAASSDARKTATRAISSVVAIRRTGYWADTETRPEAVRMDGLWTAPRACETRAKTPSGGPQVAWSDQPVV